MRPNSADYPPYFELYISKVEGDDIVKLMPESLNKVQTVLEQIPEDKADYAHAPGKWTVKQALQHCIDTERVFAYRALCLARGEQQPLPGFDQDAYAVNVNVENKPLEYLKKEMLMVRQTTLLLFEHFTDAELNRVGTVSNYRTTVLALGFNIIGHWLHHVSIFKDKYGILKG